MKIDLKILSTYNRPKIIAAREFIERAVNSEAYKKFVLAHEFSQMDQDLFEDDLPAILEIMLKDIRVQYQVVPRPWFKRWSSVIGYTQNGVITTYIPSFDAMSVPELAGHLWHEILHLKGFGHTFDPVPGREGSIPYACGYWVENFANLGCTV